MTQPDHEVEWAVLRGPLPLEHRGPVDGGVLGTLVGRSKTLLRVGGAVLALVGSGAAGSFLAVRNYYVEQGRSLEVRDREKLEAKAQADLVRGLVRRVEACEDALNLPSPQQP